MYIALISIIVSVTLSTFIAIFLVYKMSNSNRVIKSLQLHVNELNKSLSRVANQHVAVIETKINELKQVHAKITRDPNAFKAKAGVTSSAGYLDKENKKNLPTSQTAKVRFAHESKLSQIQNQNQNQSQSKNQELNSDAVQHPKPISVKIHELLKEGYSVEAVARKLTIAQEQVELIRSLRELS